MRCGNFSAERLKTSVSHRTPFWCGTLAMWSPSNTSVKLHLQVSAWSWTIFAAQMYRLQATTASKKKSTKTVATTIDVNTCPHALANLDAQVLKHDCILTSNVKVVRSRSYRTHRAIEISLRSGSADVQRDAMGSPPNILECRKDYIKPPVFLRAVYTRLIAIKHDQIRIDAKCIHVDAIATCAFR